jgi:hypothetical protein
LKCGKKRVECDFRRGFAGGSDLRVGQADAISAARGQRGLRQVSDPGKFNFETVDSTIM